MTFCKSCRKTFPISSVFDISFCSYIELKCSPHTVDKSTLNWIKASRNSVLPYRQNEEKKISSCLKFHHGVSEKLVLLARFTLTLNVRWDNSIRWRAASAPTDAAIRHQNSGDKIMWRCSVCNTINCPTRCRVCKVINTLAETPTLPLLVTGITNSHLQITLRCVAFGTQTWNNVCGEEKNDNNNIMKWKSHLFNSFSPLFERKLDPSGGSRKKLN